MRECRFYELIPVIIKGKEPRWYYLGSDCEIRYVRKVGPIFKILGRAVLLNQKIAAAVSCGQPCLVSLSAFELKFW